MSVLFRVLVGAFVCVAPTVLFLGLWNGLQRMQNGELVERVAGHHGATVEDLVPGTRSSATQGFDSRERRAIEGAVADGTAPSTNDGPSPSDRRDQP